MKKRTFPTNEQRFKFKLALALGLPHPLWLDFLLSKNQLCEWIEYYNLEPFSSDRTEYQLALIAQMIASALGAKKPKIDDFMICKKSKPSLKAQKIIFEEAFKNINKKN